MNILADTGLSGIGKFGLGLTAVGTALAGGDPMRPILERRDLFERERRKEIIAEQLARMGIQGPRRAIIETLPLERQQQYLLSELERRKAAAAAEAAYSMREEAARAQRERERSALLDIIGPRAKPGARLGPTVDAAREGATSGADLFRMQTEVPHLGVDDLVRARVSLPDSAFRTVKEIFEIQNERGDQPTDDIREYMFARENGFSGSFADWMRGGRTSAKDLEIKRLMSDLGLDRKTAVKLAYGVVRAVPTADGGVQVVDMTAPGASAPADDQDGGGKVPDFTGARETFGPLGAVRKGVNTALDAAGLGLAFEDAARTRAVLRNMNLRAKLQLTSPLGGKDTVYNSQQIEAILPDPDRILTGPESERLKAQALVEALEEQMRLAREVAGASSGYTATQRSEAREALRNMENLVEEYRALSEAIGGEPVSGEIDGIGWEIVE